MGRGHRDLEVSSCRSVSSAVLDGNGSGQLSDFSGYTRVQGQWGLHIAIMLSSGSYFLTL